MSRLSRLAAVGIVAGVAVLSAPAQANADNCILKACYQCVMYPCGPGDWVPFLRDRVGDTVCNVGGC